MKVILKKNLIVLILLFSLTLQLTSCIKGKIEYMHDKSEISRIEIVEASYDCRDDKATQYLISPVDNIQEFLNELDKLDTTFYIIGGFPQGIEYNSLAIKILYNNGDYQLFNCHEESLYYADLDEYHIYEGTTIIDSELEALITKYLDSAENPVFRYLHEKSLVSSVEIVENTRDHGFEIHTSVEDKESFFARLESISYTHDVEYRHAISFGDKSVKINYVNGDYEVFTHCLREVYLENWNGRYFPVYMGNFEENAFNALMQKYIDMNNN